MADIRDIFRGEAVRASILPCVARGTTTPRDIASAIGITQSRVCQHINRLVAEGRLRLLHPRRGTMPPVYAVAVQ